MDNLQLANLLNNTFTDYAFEAKTDVHSGANVVEAEVGDAKVIFSIAGHRGHLFGFVVVPTVYRFKEASLFDFGGYIEASEENALAAFKKALSALSQEDIYDESKPLADNILNIF